MHEAKAPTLTPTLIICLVPHYQPAVASTTSL